MGRMIADRAMQVERGVARMDGPRERCEYVFTGQRCAVAGGSTVLEASPRLHQASSGKDLDMQRHPDLKVQRLTIGRELAPLVVIDNVVADAEQLVEMAASKVFGDPGTYFPGVRSKAPLSYQNFLLQQFGPLFDEAFGLGGRKLTFTACHFSLVTLPPQKLTHLQCIPHFDSLNHDELAFVHYLFKKPHGGTAFYRHRKTGFEYVDHARKDEYFAQVQREKDGPDRPAQAYINGDTALYEQLGKQEGVFNRMLVYRRTSLHSADLSPDFALDPDPRTGRLSFNGFLQ
jgi:hypothetical protein